jgi:hypothetical protein
MQMNAARLPIHPCASSNPEILEFTAKKPMAE